jgi:Leucine-rich repeat (LRR) protein
MVNDQKRIISEIGKIIYRDIPVFDKIDWKPVGVEYDSRENVTGLCLYQCALTSLPDSIRKLTNIKSLFLGRNALQTVPDWIADLKSLEVIDLFENNLKTLPDSICTLPSLQKLVLNNNQLKELPERIGSIKSLLYLEILKNPLESLPTSLRQFADMYSDFRELATTQYGWKESSRETLRLLKERSVKIRDVSNK